MQDVGSRRTVDEALWLSARLQAAHGWAWLNGSSKVGQTAGLHGTLGIICSEWGLDGSRVLVQGKESGWIAPAGSGPMCAILNMSLDLLCARRTSSPADPTHVRADRLRRWASSLTAVCYAPSC